jgi:hypothetical protein
MEFSCKKNRIVYAIQTENARKAKSIYYMARSLINVSFPHSKPKDTYFEKRNGNFTLSMTSTNSRYGLPYGSIARLLLVWITQQAVVNSYNELLDINQKLEINLSKSFAAFIKILGLSCSGGVACSRVRIREQLLRLLTTTISFYWHDRKNNHVEGNQFNISRSYLLWWTASEKTSNGSIKPISKIIISKDFYEEIITNPVPIDFRVLQALTKSPMQIDIYIFLTYRFSFLKNEVFIPWRLLKNQFGSSYPNNGQGILNFKRKFKQALNKVWEIYPEANVQIEGSGVYLFPSNTHVEKQEKMWISPVDKVVMHAQTVLNNQQFHAQMVPEARTNGTVI